MNDTENERLSLLGSTEARNSSDQLKQLDEQAKAWGDNTQLRQIAEQAKAWGSNTQLKQLAEQAKAWGSDPQLKQLAEEINAWGSSTQLKQLAEQAKAWGSDPQLKQLAEEINAWGSSTRLKQLAEQAKAWGSDPRLKQLAEEINAWGSSTQLKQLAEQAKNWGNNGKLRQIAEQTLTWGLTFDVVVSELVARSGKSVEISTTELKSDQVIADIEGSVSIGDYFIGGAISAPSATPVLSIIPTWILYLWMICIAPALVVLTNWEAVRTGLVDINARMPQTKSIAELRRFIHSNLAGKPGDIRLVTRSDVRLRAAPGMKSTVIMTLPQYAPVVVLGKEDRTWLYVSYEHDGFLIDGYISTKFLKKIRK
ncbi:SH3 domain-containing protein [Pseudomonas cucumis]|uniref:SH3 domain-containing protein n=1 Tax=Pseudomonas cucumis TaxID=2954082 RepID=A0ABY9EQD5_9PSED|nr:SH3 domain-containing protein [Pseudomonas cucumis]WLG82936.1 SH3 domain-containing protein [Pseudomonas cucumis]